MRPRLAPRRATLIALAAIAGAPGAGCSSGDDAAPADAARPETEAIALAAPILNTYDPNQRGTFVSSRTGVCPGWMPLEDRWQVWTGLLTAGNPACDASNIASGCPYPPSGLSGTGTHQQNPKYSGEDYGGTHDGRDLNFTFLPTNWERTTVNPNVSMPDQSVAIEVEVEAPYFWPTVNWFNDRYSTAVFREGATPGGLNYREPWNLPTPQPGDQIVFNGMHVRDECHGDPAEIHPPQASAWLRKVGSHDYDLTFNAASHSFRPFRDDRANLPGAWYWFRLHDASLAPQVTYAGDNWLVDPNRSYTAFSGHQPIRLCNDGNLLGQPDASFAGGDPCRAQLGSHRRVDEFFTAYTSAGVAGDYRYVGVYLASKPGMENAAGLPVLGSGTYRVCQPHASNGYCAPRLPTFKQVSRGITPKQLRVNFKNFNSGLWGDFEWDDNVVGRRFQQHSYNGGNNQTFNLEHVTTDATGPIFKIQNHNGRFFDACCGSGNGQPVAQEVRYDDAWQQWRFLPVGGGTTGLPTGYNIKNVQTGRCIAIGGGSVASGADALLWDCGGQPDTLWHLMERE